VTDPEKELKAELETAQYRGEQIDAFLNNEAVLAVFQALEVSYFTAWKESRDPAEREVLHAKASALDEMKESLRAVASSGERATHDLKALERTTDQI
jgi:hypothetical protein